MKKKITKIDAVLHFAALADLNQAINKPLETVETNILGTVNVLEFCKKNKIEKFLFASTIYTNGIHGGFYRCSKKACEDYIIEYSKKYKINYQILKFGSLYGPGSDDKNGLYKIIDYALKKGIVKYEGDRNSIREYIHVNDASHAVYQLLSNNKFYGKKINITGNQSIKIVDLLETIKELLGIKKPIKFSKSKSEGHYVRLPHNYIRDISLKFLINPYIDFSEGLNQLTEYVSQKCNETVSK